MEGASTGRVFAAFLHIFVSVPFTVAAIDLALVTARTVGERLFPLLSFALFGVVAIVTIVAVTLFVSGALIGAAGVLTHIQSHKVLGQAAMAGGVVAGAVFILAGDFVLGWTIAIISVAAFLAQTAAWAVDRRAA